MELIAYQPMNWADVAGVAVFVFGGVAALFVYAKYMQ